MKINDMFNTILNKLKRNVFLDLLIIIFGMGSWIVVNGLYNQLALLVRDAPEGWALPSYMNISVQLANIGVFIHVLLKKIFKDKLNNECYIYVMMILTCIATLLLAFFYNRTIEINQTSYSAMLYILVFIAAYYGCTSNVTSYPYLNTFNSMYVTSYFVGEGMSHMVPSIVSLVQGVNKESNCNTTSINLNENEVLFGTKEFILFLFSMMSLSVIAFILMNNLTICKREQISDDVNHRTSCANDEKSDKCNFSTVCWLILMIALNFFLYGIYPSIKSYSALPYGYKAYHLSIILSDIANPIISSMPFFISNMSSTFILSNLLIGSVTGAYVITTAIQSPSPILVDTDAGMILVVIAWIIAPGFFQLIKIIIATKFRHKGDKWMIWCGASIQIGAASGSVTGFVLINYTKIFVERDLCVR